MRHIGLLFWLKWKLILRGYRRNTSALVGAILMLLFFAPFSIGIAFLAGLGFTQLNPEYALQLLTGVLLGIWLFWLLAPLVGYSINDSYDITRLFVYPLTIRQIFTGAVLGSLLDVPTLLLLPTLIAAVVTFSAGSLSLPLSFPFVLLALSMFLFHTLTLSQAILLFSAGVLKSRRFRDLSLIFFSIFGMLYYALSRTLASASFEHTDWNALIDSPIWKSLSLLPPGAAAGAAGAARMGDYGPAFLWLILLTVYTAGAVYLASWLLQKVYAGDVVGPSARRSNIQPQEEIASPAVPPQSASTTSTVPAFVNRAPPVVQAVVEKEIKYLFRDPYFKVVLSSLAYVLFVMGFTLLSGTRHGVGQSGGWGLWITTFLLLLTETGLVCNQFGNEGGAATVLFLYPCSRRQILIGKNLTLFLALSVVNLVVIIVLCALSRAWQQLGLLLMWIELALMVMLSAGNFLSIYFPYRLVMRGWRIRYGSGSSGFGYFMLYLGMLLLVLLILTPVLVALILPLAFHTPGWFLISLPLALAYAAGCYLISLFFATPLLLRREPEIIAKLSQTE